MAPKYKLTYFNVVALAEPIKFAFHYGKIPFEDVKIEKENWPQLKDKTPMGKLPILEVDGKVVHQSGAILRYVGKQAGLYGDSDWDQLQIDIVLDTLVDMKNAFRPIHSETDEAKKAALDKTFKEETLPFYLARLEKQVADNGGHFVGGKFTIADIAFTTLSGNIEGYFKGTMGSYPKLEALKNKVLEVPQIKAYVASRS